MSTRRQAVRAGRCRAAQRRAVRVRLPDERQSVTHKFSIAGHEGYLTVGLYENGHPGEIFLRMAKEAGAKFSFGTNNGGANDLGDWSYPLEMQQALELSWEDMYVPGHACNKYHVEKYGPLSEFGYKDFIPMFKAEKFDADEWLLPFGFHRLPLLDAPPGLDAARAARELSAPVLHPHEPSELGAKRILCEERQREAVRWPRQSEHGVGASA